MKFTRIHEDDNFFADGDYKAEIVKIEKKEGLYGETISVLWLIHEPLDYKGRLKWENFNVGSDIEEYREKAIKSFNKFWSQLTDDDNGIDIDFEKVVNLEAIIRMKNYNTKEGVKCSYIVHRSRPESQKLAFSLPQSPRETSVLPNDEIPF